MRLRMIVTGCACIFALTCSAAHSAVPTSITVQGKLTDVSGNPLPAGIKKLTFRIFDQSSGGSEIWPGGGEAQNVTTGIDGLWIAQLGVFQPLTDAVFADTVRWLEITVVDSLNSETTMPRVRLVTGPYAFRVATVDGASGGTITSKVSIGLGHTNTGTNAFVAGENNAVLGNWAVVSGGHSDTASGMSSAIGGGESNVAKGDWSFVGGGQGNTAGTAVDGGSTVTGGAGNSATGNLTTIGGGEFNNASGFATTIAGGSYCVVSGFESTVGGGFGNAAEGSYVTVAGGDFNFASGSYSSIGGGRYDTATGVWATVPGGGGNKAAGYFSLAAGKRAKALHHGSFVWADSAGSDDFVSTGIDQFLVRAAGGLGVNTNAPYEDLSINGTLGFKNGNDPEVFMFESGTANADRMIIAHNPSNTDWGLKYRDFEDEFIFQSSGGTALDVDLSNHRIGVGVSDPQNIIQVQQTSPTDPVADAWTEYSSRRWKTNITEIVDPLAKVQRLRGVTYDWKADGKHDIGLIAEEVGEVIPEVVAYEENGIDAKSVDYARLTALLIEAVKEQQKRIEALEKKLEQSTP